MIRTSKQMKRFLGLVNWYSICIKHYADLAAPLIESLQGNYKHAQKVQGEKGRCKTAKEDNFIRCTDEMKTSFEKIKLASPEGEYTIHVDACTYGIGAVLLQKTPDGKWVLCDFFSRKLEGKPGQGQRGWSVREQRTYAIVTIDIENKSQDSWYKEDLCTMSGPPGRRGRGHEFLSRYSIVVA